MQMEFEANRVQYPLQVNGLDMKFDDKEYKNMKKYI